jgi:hypothetical protein
MGLAQVFDRASGVPNGGVSTILPSGGTIYIGGDFTRVGPVTGGGSALDASSGFAQPQYRVEGAVWAEDDQERHRMAVKLGRGRREGVRAGRPHAAGRLLYVLQTEDAK